MKLSKFLLIGAIALGLTACNNDDLPEDNVDGKEANTHVTISLSLAKGSSARALPNDYNYVGEWAGKDKINTVDIYLVDGVTVERTTLSIDDYDVSKEADNTVYLKPKKGIRTTSGIKTVYVLINAKTEVTDVLATTSAQAFKTAYETAIVELTNSETSIDVSTSADKLAVKNGVDDETIVMTNLAGVSINVAPNVTEDETKADTNPKNRASVVVERAVARVMVTTKQLTYQVPSLDGGLPIGELTDITWVVAQGENSLYVQRQDNWITPNYVWVPGQGSDNFISQAGNKYDYSGLFENRSNKFGGTDVPTTDDYTQASAIGKITADLDEKLSGKFILPNTHAYAAAPEGEATYTGGYRKGNTAYVLVRAKFTPAELADNGTLAADGTFYLGGIDGLFYSTAQAAYDAGNTTIAKYVEGKVLYYAWLNPDNVPNWYNSPVIRNNIYHIHITGFKNLGTHWNPLFPEDPDNPTLIEDPDNPGGPQIPSNPDPRPEVKVEDPENPGEEIEVPDPENPIDPEDPLTTPETYMSVDVTVLPWLVHSYGVDLGI
jgi:hypothetical protein